MYGWVHLKIKCYPIPIPVHTLGMDVACSRNARVQRVAAYNCTHNADIIDDAVTKIHSTLNVLHVRSVMLVRCNVIADLRYTTKCSKTYVWVHRPKNGEREGEREETGEEVFTFSPKKIDQG